MFLADLVTSGDLLGAGGGKVLVTFALLGSLCTNPCEHVLVYVTEALSCWLRTLEIQT